jgi:hypothetical protein
MSYAFRNQTSRGRKARKAVWFTVPIVYSIEDVRFKK